MNRFMKNGHVRFVLRIILIVLLTVGMTTCINPRKRRRHRNRQRVTQTVRKKSQQKQKKSGATEPQVPQVVFGEKGYKLELPTSAGDVECVAVSDEWRSQLKSQGHNFITTPLHVTRNGEEHVQLDSIAVISIAIPKNFPKDQYRNLVGVLLTEKGPQYKLPDYYGLREGVVRFKTDHFCVAGAEKDSVEALRQKFIGYVTTNGWQKTMNDKTLEPKWKEQLSKFADDHYMGKDDLLGIAFREVYSDFEVVKSIVDVSSDIIEAHDMENASIEQRIEVATENAVKIAETKILSYFLNKLKENETKEKKVIDEIKSKRKGEILYKKELEEIESQRNQIIEVLQDRFSIDDVEELGTQLGKDSSPEKCFVYASKYLSKVTIDQLKSQAKALCPYVKAVQATGKAVEIGKKYLAADRMNDMYEFYRRMVDESENNRDMAWDIIESEKLAASDFWHGMEPSEIRKMFEERYREEKDLKKREAEVKETLALIENNVRLNNEYFEGRKYDYVTRLTRVYNLMERFREELVDKKGNISYNDNGYRQIIQHPKNVNQQLCYVVDKYLECYPDQKKFYEWLAKNGYYQNKLNKDFARMDAAMKNVKKPDSGQPKDKEEGNVPEEISKLLAPYGGISKVVPDLKGDVSKITKCYITHSPTAGEAPYYDITVCYSGVSCRLILYFQADGKKPYRCMFMPPVEEKGRYPEEFEPR